MALGPFARVIAQFAVVAGGAIGRAVLEAYKEAAAGRGGGAAGAAARKLGRRRMTIDEARNILEVEATTEFAKIEERGDVLHKLNEGSPYLQARITAARKIIEETKAEAKVE
mmetsp:Transcript_19506/g.44371  ORF Transcript_19506/g.44371 Transcript_19506/m.44371 type:complete len:112 (-) Transcript_19506:88-423(-)